MTRPPERNTAIGCGLKGRRLRNRSTTCSPEPPLVHVEKGLEGSRDLYHGNSEVCFSCLSDNRPNQRGGSSVCLRATSGCRCHRGRSTLPLIGSSEPRHLNEKRTSAVFFKRPYRSLGVCSPNARSWFHLQFKSEFDLFPSCCCSI